MKNKFLLICMAVLLVGCGGVLDKQIDPKSMVEDLAKIQQKYGDRYSTTDYDAILGYLVNQSADPDSPRKTYGEVLDAVKEARETAEREYRQALEAYQAAAATLNEALGLKVKSKGFFTSSYVDYFGFIFDLTNRSDKTITQVTGRLTVTNSEGRPLGSYSISQEEQVGPGVTVEGSEVFYHDSTEPKEIMIKRAEMEDLSFEWNPTSITFSDGTQLTTPEIPRALD